VRRFTNSLSFFMGLTQYSTKANFFALILHILTVHLVENNQGILRSFLMIAVAVRPSIRGILKSIVLGRIPGVNVRRSTASNHSPTLAEQRAFLNVHKSLAHIAVSPPQRTIIDGGSIAWGRKMQCFSLGQGTGVIAP
jgi:hypothetical protein